MQQQDGHKEYGLRYMSTLFEDVRVYMDDAKKRSAAKRGVVPTLVRTYAAPSLPTRPYDIVSQCYPG